MSFRFLRPLVGLIGAALAAAIETTGKTRAAFVGNSAVIIETMALLTWRDEQNNGRPIGWA